MGNGGTQGIAVAPPAERGADRAARTERALVKAAQQGDPDAWEEIARRHWDEAYHAAYLILRDPRAAEDVAQESIVKALEGLGGFDRRRRFRPWLHRIVANRSIDWLRARDRRNEVAIDYARDEPAEARTDMTEFGAVVPALVRLDPTTRAVVVLRCLFDYRAREIARMLDTTPGAVRTRLHRGLQELRDHLDQEQK